MERRTNSGQIMNIQNITILVNFNFWANDRILAACQKLTTDEFTRAVSPDPGWGSLRGILVHTLDAEYGWRLILQGQEANNILEASDFETVAVLKTRWDIEKNAWVDYVNSLSTERLNRGYGENSQPGPNVWQTMLHVIFHGTQHRSEAAAILTGYGHSPGDLDFDIFLQEKE